MLFRSKQRNVAGDSEVFKEEEKINTDEADKAWENKKDDIEEIKNVSITDLLNNLPNPQNEYNIEEPDIPEEEPKLKDIQEDMEDVEKREEERRKKEDELQVSSLVLKRNLPRPYIAIKPITQFGDPEVSELIDSEIQKLVEYDNFTHPGKFIKAPEIVNNMEEFSREELIEAQELIEEEQKKPEDIFEDWDKINNSLIYFPRDKKYDTAEGKSLAILVEAKDKELKRYSAHFEKLRKNINKTEEKANRSE